MYILFVKNLDDQQMPSDQMSTEVMRSRTDADRKKGGQ